MRRVGTRVAGLWLLLVAAAGPVHAQTTVAGDLEVGARLFPAAGTSAQQAQFFPLLQGSLLATHVSPRKHSHLRINVFGRADVHDPRSSHGDVREATWTWLPYQTWDVRVGILAEKWGVTESNAVIDVVNQRDQLEPPGSDTKLGQPGLSLAERLSIGGLTAFVLPVHRAWEFAGATGRFRPPVTVSTQHPSAGAVAWAARWDLRTPRVEMSIGHYRGASKEPTIGPSTGGLQASYPLVRHESADLQIVAGTGLLKVDVVHVTPREQSAWSSITIGGEWPVTLGASDLTVLAEFTYDARGRSAPTGLDRDLLTAVRWRANNVAGTEVMASSLIDVGGGSRLSRATISTRFNGAWRWTAEFFILTHPRPGDVGYWLRRDSYVQVGVARFF